MSSGSRFHRLTFLALVVAACGSPGPTGTTPPPLTGPDPFVVSNPVSVGSMGGNLMQAGASSDQVAFVSLPSGTWRGEFAVILRVLRTGAVVAAALIDGGLDPVAIPAVVGDTIALTLTGSAGASWLYLFTIPPRRPPVIVRTNPGKNKRDVPLNSRIEVVISEPILSASLTPENFELRTGGTPVAGQLSFANPEQTIVTFTPAEELAGATDYELVLRPGIRDLEGTPLGAGASIPFTTVQTRASPEFAGLAFVRDSQIHVIRADGALVRLTNTGPGVWNLDPTWSPDGQRLAFASNRAGRKIGAFADTSDIYVMNADGSNVVRRTSGGYNVDPAWSPDGRTIAFTTLEQGSAGIAVIDAAGAQGPMVLLDRPGYDAQPSWSPDGQRITFTSDWRAYDFVYDLYVMNADGSDVRELLVGPFLSADGPQFYYQSAWSPDGQQIAVQVCDNGWIICGSLSGIAVLNADGSGLRWLVKDALQASPTWSPDGRTVVFSSSRCWECQSDLWFTRADGSAEGPILTNGHSPSWRP